MAAEAPRPVPDAPPTPGVIEPPRGASLEPHQQPGLPVVGVDKGDLLARRAMPSAATIPTPITDAVPDHSQEPAQEEPRSGAMIRTHGFLHRPGELVTGPVYNDIDAVIDTKTNQVVIVGRDSLGSTEITHPSDWEPVLDEPVEEIKGIGEDGTLIYVPDSFGGREHDLVSRAPDGQIIPIEPEEDDPDSPRIRRVNISEAALRGEVTPAYLAGLSQTDAQDEAAPLSDSTLQKLKGEADQRRKIEEEPEQSKQFEQPDLREDRAYDGLASSRHHLFTRVASFAASDTPTSIDQAEQKAAILEGMQAAAGGAITLQDIQSFAGHTITNLDLEKAKGEVDSMYASGNIAGLPPKEVMDAYFADRIAEAEKLEGILPVRVPAKGDEVGVVEREVAEKGVNFEIPEEAEHPVAYARVVEKTRLEKLRGRLGL